MDYEKDQDVSDSGMHEIQSSEPPRYEHYQMHRNSGSCLLYTSRCV